MGYLPALVIFSIIAVIGICIVTVLWGSLIYAAISVYKEAKDKGGG